MRREESCCPRATASGVARDPLRSRAALASPNRLLVYKRRAPPAREDRRGVSRGDRKWLRELYGRCPGATTAYFGWRPSIFLGAQRTLRSIADRPLNPSPFRAMLARSVSRRAVGITTRPSPELAAAPPSSIPEIARPTTP